MYVYICIYIFTKCHFTRAFEPDIVVYIVVL